MYKRRALKDIQAITKNPPKGISLQSTDSAQEVVVSIEISDNELYTKPYELKVIFDTNYPFEPPQVKFINEIPMHPHIYSNGHICLNVLAEDWTAAQSLETIVLSIQSMLTHNTQNCRPPDDSSYVVIAPSNPKKTRWQFHDDDV